MAKANVKKKRVAEDLTLWDVILSYPQLHDPKPYKGKIYYSTDILLEADHAQLKALKKAINGVAVKSWGEDKTEWPEMKPFIVDGNTREDQKGYTDRFYIKAATQTPVPVIDLKGKAFNPQSVKGGMFANVAIRISAWEFDGDEGMSIYLQGVQIDTTKPGLNFGGGKSVQQMFKRDGDEEDHNEDDADNTDDDSSADEPRGKKSKKAFDDDEE